MTQLYLLCLCFLQIALAHPLNEDTGHKRSIRDVNAIQDKLIQVLNPQPILDTIKEHEKCCNNQQHLFGKKVVDTYDKFSKALVNVFEFPQQKTNALGKKLTQVLDVIGGKLVGLT